MLLQYKLSRPGGQFGPECLGQITQISWSICPGMTRQFNPEVGCLRMLHGQFAPEYLVRPPGTPWSNTGGTHFHVAAERLINFSGIPNLDDLISVKETAHAGRHSLVYCELKLNFGQERFYISELYIKNYNEFRSVLLNEGKDMDD